jgi:subtilisin family serine protease
LRVLLLAWLAVGAVVTGTAASDVVPPALKQKALTEGSVPVIVQLQSPFVPEALLDVASAAGQQQGIRGLQAAVLSYLATHAHRVHHLYETIPLLALEVGPDALRVLEALPWLVARVDEDALAAPALNESGPLVEAVLAWAAGFEGTGAVVAVLDTGVDGAHPFLAGKVVEEACFSRGQDGFVNGVGNCPNGLDSQLGPGSAIPCTYAVAGCRHGTHVAGIAAGASGIARGAQIMAVQVFSRFTGSANCGSGEDPCALSFTSDYIAGLERVYSLRTTRNIVAVNMSLGGSAFVSPCDSDPAKPIIDNLRAAGIATVIASGNNSLSNGLSSPGCISSAISVGSTGDGSLGAVVDQVSSFSNSATFLSLLAPGQWISSSIPGGGYQNFQGTSMATPHVAGAWAVIKQRSPAASVSTVLGALQSTGLPVTDPRNGVTKRRIRIAQALATFGGGGGGAAPDPPAGLQQFRPDGLTTIPIGGPAPEAIVIVKGTVSDPGGQTVRLQVEARPVGTAFNGAPTHESGLVTSGTAATVTVAGLAAGSDYHWRARAVDADGATSAWVAFGGNAETAPDFTVVSAAPLLTASPDTVAPGGSVSGSWSGIPSPAATDWIGLYAVGASDFSFLAWTYVSCEQAPLVARPSGSCVLVVPASVGPGSYQLRLFTSDSFTRIATSNPISVGGSNPLPVAPTGLAQLRADGVTAIGVGGATPEATVQLGGTVSDPLGQTVRLQVEVRPIATSFNGTVTHESGLVGSGASVKATVSGLAAGTSYHWRARTTDSQGASSAWVSFGGNSEIAPDFVVSPNAAPGSPAGLGQFRTDGTTPIAVGGATTETAIVVKGTVTDVDAGQTVKLQVEVRAVGTPFSNAFTHESALGSSGGVASVTVNGLAGGPAFHWQARAVDSQGGASPWGSFGGNAESAGDFTVTALGPTLTASPTSAAPGASVTATWSGIASAAAADWIAMARQGTPDTQYIVWTYVSCTLTPVSPRPSGSCALQVPVSAAAGAYELRFFSNDGFGRLATSNPFTVGNETPPAGPAGLAQVRTDGVTPIAAGGSTPETAVFLRGTVSDPASQTVKLQVEVRPLGTAFANAMTHESGFVASGAMASATVAGLAGGVSYHWQARAVDVAGGASAWTSFGANAESAADFSVTVVNAPPAVPASLDQFRSNGTTTIGVGGSTPETTVVLKGSVSDPDAGQTVKLQVEVRPLGTAFSNAMTHEGALVSSGGVATATVTALVAGTGYHWQVRAVDSLGGASVWVAFGGNAESAADFSVTGAVNTPPGAPTALGQFRANGTTSIGVGASTPESTVILRGTVSDPDAGQTVRLQVEVRPLSTAFSNAMTHESSPVTTGSPASATVGSLTTGTGYHWQARTVDSLGQASTWVAFGGNAESVADFTVAAASGPSLAASPASVAAGGNVIATWSGIASPAGADWIAVAAVGDPDAVYVAWTYVNCAQVPGPPRAAGSCAIPIPAGTPPGAYELRLYANNGLLRLATSNPITITP